jgi:hypothetical protein
MRYRWESDDNEPGRHYLKLAPIPQRWIPDFGHRWSDWLDGRRNMRRTPEQDLAADEIRAWLTSILSPDGSVDSVSHVRRKDQVDFVVRYRERRQQLEFWTVRAWPGIDPRDELASDLLEALRDPNETDPISFGLGSYAEQSEFDRPDPAG